jgi:hypothetical protein
MAFHPEIPGFKGSEILLAIDQLIETSQPILQVLDQKDQSKLSLALCIDHEHELNYPS